MVCFYFKERMVFLFEKKMKSVHFFRIGVRMSEIRIGDGIIGGLFRWEVDLVWEVV